MADAEPPASIPDAGDPPGAVPAAARAAAWWPWLAVGWVALLVLTAVAELGGLDDLRLALDFQRHFR